MNDIEKLNAELKEILIQLSYTLHKIETTVPVREHENYFNRLPSFSKSIIDKLLNLWEKREDAKSDVTQNNDNPAGTVDLPSDRCQTQCNLTTTTPPYPLKDSARSNEKRNLSNTATGSSTESLNENTRSNIT